MSVTSKRVGVVVAALAILLALLFALITQSAASVPLSNPPSASDIVKAKRAFEAVQRGSSGPEGPKFTLGQSDLAAIAALMSDSKQPTRIGIALNGSTVVLSASHPAPLGRWFNASAEVSHSKDAPLAIAYRLGAISISPEISKWLTGAGRSAAKAVGKDLPDPYEIGRGIVIADSTIMGTLGGPGKGGGLVVTMLALTVDGIDAASAAQTFCALADQQTRQPTSSFADIVKRAFQFPLSGKSPAEANRARFLAIGMFTVDTRVAKLAPGTADLIKACRAKVPVLQLHGREDLAKHWALSAALSSAGNPQISRALGEWKELSDSLPNGSGFSFVDLSADRAGTAIALAARGDDAQKLSAILAKATPTQLLSKQVLDLPEGLSEQAFKRRFGDQRSQAFKQMVQRIDRFIVVPG